MLKIFTGQISSDDMTKQLIITSCDECPYLIKESEDAWFRPMCVNTNRIFDYDEVNINIPSDCPLDDTP